MPDINTRSLFVTNGTIDNEASPSTITGGTTVEVTIQTIEESFEKKLIELQTPIPKNDQPKQGGSKTPDLKLTDFLRVRQVVTVKGILAEESSESALTKKNNLKTVIERGGTFK